jgi:hypothetical protein
VLWAKHSLVPITESEPDFKELDAGEHKVGLEEHIEISAAL